tara:strand:+ start:72 stop:224 length:153 start_codon:yes stop_codon:yes gene_type:complete
MSRTEQILTQLIEDLDLAIIKAKAQLEYVDEPIEWHSKHFAKKYVEVKNE